MLALTGLSFAGNILLAGVPGGLETVIVVGLLRCSKAALRLVTLGLGDDIRSRASKQYTVDVNSVWAGAE